MPPRPRHPKGLARASLPFRLLVVLASSSACFRPVEAGPDLTRAEREAEIAALEASIADDRAALADMVTQPRDVEVDPLHEDEDLRAIADRLEASTRALALLREPVDPARETGSP